MESSLGKEKIILSNRGNKIIKITTKDNNLKTNNSQKRITINLTTNNPLTTKKEDLLKEKRLYGLHKEIKLSIQRLNLE